MLLAPTGEVQLDVGAENALQPWGGGGGGISWTSVVLPAAEAKKAYGASWTTLVMIMHPALSWRLVSMHCCPCRH